MRWVVVFIFVTLNLYACKQESISDAVDVLPLLPEGFDQPLTPEDNPITSHKIRLGEQLFFDTHLSKNNTLSCASCHNPQFAFSDSSKVSIGANGELGFRNTPSLVNAAYKTLYHMDGGVKTLELQVIAPILDTNELGHDFAILMEYISTNPKYQKLFKSAFDTVPTIYGLTRAIATYERSLIYGDSDYDRFVNGDSSAFTDNQVKGMNLFYSKKLNCTACHSGRQFTNYSFQNVGMVHQSNDSGRARVTFNSADAGKFVVPTLRNIALTSPYMHDGSIGDLDQVILYFEKGGDSHPNKSGLLQPFTLQPSERMQLLSFLEGLTDHAFIKK